MAYADLAPLLNSLGITENEVLEPADNTHAAITKLTALEVITELANKETSNNPWEVAAKLNCSVADVQQISREITFTKDPSAAVPEEPEV